MTEALRLGYILPWAPCFVLVCHFALSLQTRRHIPG